MPYCIWANFEAPRDAIMGSVWRNGWGPQSGEKSNRVGDESLVFVKAWGEYTCTGHMAARQSFVRLDH
jgi:hypothetical protein